MTDQIEKEIGRGARYAHFRDEFRDVFDSIRAAVDSKIDTVPLVQTEMHTKLVITRQVLAQIEKHIQTVIDTGRMASFQLEEERRRESIIQKTMDQARGLFR